MRAPPLVLLLVAALAATSCFYTLARQDALVEGELQGRALREGGGGPASFAFASIEGSSRVVRANAEGSFSLPGLQPGSWLARVIDDEDRDGVADRAGFVRATVVRAETRKGLTDGIFAAAPEETVAVLVGDLVLQSTGSITGRVAAADEAGVERPLALAAERVTIALFRDLSTALDDDPISLAVEATAHAASDGSFRFTGVPAGEVRLAAFLQPRDGDGVVDTKRVLFFGTARAQVSPGEETALPLPIDVVTPGETDGSPVTTAVGITLTGAPAAPTPALVFFDAPDTGSNVAIGEAETDSFISVEGPIGLWTMTVQPDGGAPGVVRGVAVVPSTFFGPVELPPPVDLCLDDTGVRDCDHDSRTGLPLPDPERDDIAAVRDLFTACAPACVAAFGAAIVDATCEVRGETFDCDDDADGQADVTEPFACLGPGKGTDRDGNGLCEPAADAAVPPFAPLPLFPDNQGSGEVVPTEPGGQADGGNTNPDGGADEPPDSVDPDGGAVEPPDAGI